MDHSPYLDLDDAIRQAGDAVPLAWARSGAHGPANLGDSTSAVVVASLAGLPVVPRTFDDTTPRLLAVGTIVSELRNGTLHVWGTGLDARRRAFGNRTAGFAAAPRTDYVIHAVRGPRSRQVLLQAGLHAPPIYGDGSQFMPRLLPDRVEKRHELGVVVHLSELAEAALGATPPHPRYAGGEADGVRIISTLHEPSLAGFRAKLEELLACRRIVSTSLHGKLLADAYGIPNLYFPYCPRGEGGLELALDDEEVDHRFADYYAVSLRRLPAYAQPPEGTTRWDRVIAAVDRLWQPFRHPHAAMLLEAFPIRREVSISDELWPLHPSLHEALDW